MFGSIRPIILRFARRPGVDQGLRGQKLKAAWPEIVESVNKRAAEQTQVVELNETNELVVKVKNHLWAQELSLYQNELKKAAARRFRQIKAIRFVV